MAARRRGGGFEDDDMAKGEGAAGSSRGVSDRVKIFGTLIGLGVMVALAFSGDSARPNFLTSGLRSFTEGELSVASWNMAAINNNPFEYWLTYPDPKYTKLMDAVQAFIEDPASRDVRVKDVFTDRMFSELAASMRKQGNFEKDAIKATTKLWKSDFSHRRIVSEFVKDGTLGKKRLTSMPDRVTNTIPLKNGDFAYRPTVINCYKESMNNVDEWWAQWRAFMFSDELDTVKAGKVKPADMLAKIPRAKYPLLSEEEERISVPLQTLTAAIFDAILVHMMSVLDGDLGTATSGSVWQNMRKEICESLNLKKNDRILQILTTNYLDQDVICLQEVAGAFIERAQANDALTSVYHVVGPKTRSRSDQNSVLLLSRTRFPDGVQADITSTLSFEDPKAIAAGDITLLRVVDRFGGKFAIGSFHGDTNGLASIPLVRGVVAAVQPDEQLVLGLDANTYQHGTDGKKQDVLKFADEYRALGLDSCWGPVPNPQEFTTFNARTFLQPQLNKASARDEIREKGDVNPKDFILFKKGVMVAISVTKDNTGHKEYLEGTVFPTLEFPSDHGILSTRINVVATPGA